MATIEKRPNEQGITHYRAKIRLKGHPTEHATFARLTDAKRWAQATEAAIREGRHFKTSEAKRHTAGDMIDRYIKEVVPRHPNNAVNTMRHLNWWKAKLGHVMLSDIGPAQIVQYRTVLSTEPSPKGTLRANATPGPRRCAASAARLPVRPPRGLPQYRAGVRGMAGLRPAMKRSRSHADLLDPQAIPKFVCACWILAIPIEFLGALVGHSARTFYNN